MDNVAQALLTLDSLMLAWPSILNETKSESLSLEALLRACQPISVDHGTITLGFSYDFHRSKAEEERNMESVLNAAERVIGFRPKIKCIMKKDNVDQSQYQRKPTPVTNHVSVSLLRTKRKRHKEPATESIKTESPIEEKFWNALRLEHFITPQFRIGRYRVDFAIESHKIAIELDGHEFHKSKEQRTNDAERERYLQRQGWHVIRFTGTEIWNDVGQCISDMVAIMNSRHS
jgi:very-short-patch-repair endonuclease